MALPILRKRPVNQKRVETKAKIKTQDFWKRVSVTPEELATGKKFRETALKLIASNPELKDYEIMTSDRFFSKELYNKHKNIFDNPESSIRDYLGGMFGSTPLDSIVLDKKHNCVFFKKNKKIISIDLLKRTLSSPLHYLVESWDSYAGRTTLHTNSKQSAKIILKLMKELDVKIDNKYYERSFLEEKDKDLNILFEHFSLPELIQMGASRKLLAYRYSSKDLMRVRTRALKRT